MILTDKQATQQLFLPQILGMLANESFGSEISEVYFKKCIAVFEVILNGKDKIKIGKRSMRLGIEIVKTAMNTQNNMVSGHKLILVVFELAQRLIDQGFHFLPEVTNLIEEFLELESNHLKNENGKDLTNEDWMAIKKSAEKVVDRVFSNVEKLFF